MVVWDVAGTLPGYVRKIADDVDLIVWDLTDERLSVRAVKSGGYVTGNSNTIKHAIPDILSQPIQFGTPEHLSLWEKALGDFVAVLEETGTLDKVVVNATPWALIDNHGRPTDYPSTRIDPRWFNQTAEQYYSLIEDRRISVARVDQADAVADSDHKWGPAYFHYVPSTYRSQLDLITALKSR